MEGKQGVAHCDKSEMLILIHLVYFGELHSVFTHLTTQRSSLSNESMSGSEEGIGSEASIFRERSLNAFREEADFNRSVESEREGKMDGEEELSFQLWALAAFLCLLTAMTVIGNTLVVTAVLTKKYLRNPTGYLIMSMACADLLVGILVMPFSIILEVRAGKDWPFGLVFCDIWHSLDILASTASIWNLSVISLDRYLAISAPLKYWDMITNLRACIAIIVVWVISMSISLPAIAWWRYSSPELYENELRCEMTTEPSYVIPATILSYYFPLALTLFAYVKIFIIATSHESSLKTGQMVANQREGKGVEMRIHRGGETSERRISEDDEFDESHCSTLASGSQRLEMLFRMQARMLTMTNSNFSVSSSDSDLEETDKDDSERKPSSPRKKTSVSFAVTTPALVPNGRKYSTVTERTSLIGTQPYSHRYSLQGSSHSPHLVRSANGSNVGDRTPMLSRKRQRKLRKKASRMFSKFSQEQKAAKTLGIVVGCFVMCWLPFFVVNTIVTVCVSCISNPALAMSAVTWLGYCNSALNPFIYGYHHRQFQRAFSEIVCCGRNREKEKKRSVLLEYASNSRQRRHNSLSHL